MTQECLLLCHVTCNMSQLSCVMWPTRCATSAIKHNWSARTRRYSPTSCATSYTSCVAAVLCTGDTEECTVTVSRHRHPGTLATWTVSLRWLQDVDLKLCNKLSDTTMEIYPGEIYRLASELPRNSFRQYCQVKSVELSSFTIFLNNLSYAY